MSPGIFDRALRLHHLTISRFLPIFFKKTSHSSFIGRANDPARCPDTRGKFDFFSHLQFTDVNSESSKSLAFIKIRQLTIPGVGDHLQISI